VIRCVLGCVWQWMWKTKEPVPVPLDPNQRDLDYEQGTQLAVTPDVRTSA
jgi:hypothetical protein